MDARYFLSLFSLQVSLSFTVQDHRCRKALQNGQEKIISVARVYACNLSFFFGFIKNQVIQGFKLS